jgi:polynucleotide 5'-hydroxyl-kinase GRC3/NOL9
MEIHPQPEWEELLTEFKKHKGTVMLVGATDSGKSTLAKYMVKMLVKEAIAVSVVDADVGQSSLGLPGTISIKVFSGEKEVCNYTFEKMFFIGSTNPAKNISLMVGGSRKMVDICMERSEVIFVDTTGLITGETGRALKIGKIRAIKPKHIIALQRHDELEHILRLVENSVIHRIGVSIMAKYRDRENRMRYRQKKFLDYFDEKRISEFLLRQHDAEFFYNEKSFSLKNCDFATGTIFGLNRNDDTLALGVITEMTEDSIIFRSPIKTLTGVNRVLFGDMTSP